MTHNLKDFPSGRLPNTIEVVAPCEFAEDTVGLSPGRAWNAVAAIVKRSGRYGPSLSGNGVLETLESRYGMTGAVRLLRQTAQRR